MPEQAPGLCSGEASSRLRVGFPPVILSFFGTAVNTGLLPENAGYEQPDPECDLNIVTKENRQTEIKAAMSNAFGFGGQNSCIIVGRVSD